MTDLPLWPHVEPEAARRLMDAAVDAFAERGFHGTTTRDIATASGMSPAALYVHFPSKAAVLAAISRAGHENALVLVRSAAGRAGTATERMGWLVAEFTAWHARRHRIARVVQYELHALETSDYAVVADLRRRTERVVRELVNEGVRAGEFTVDDAGTAARAVLSLCIDVARWYTDATKPAPAELGRRYAGLVLAMLSR